MKRIDKILLEVNTAFPRGVTASEIADKLNLSRSNVSADLNKLVGTSLVSKNSSNRPVKYFMINKNSNYKVNDYSENSTEIIFELDLFSKDNPSMFKTTELIKAAVLYPPNGMNMMLLGETGVGKSMLAKLIYNYAIESERIKKDAPFIVFNCADYANNQQLLLGQIFGSKKGSYTGSLEDRKGLLEEADGGIMFFDEVHRLSPEGQEMLFTFMDNGTFRRLGDSGIKKSKVLIITATTENPKSNMLATFLRRIPMMINIPNLEERSMDERFNLISLFFKNEATKLGRAIKVSINTVRSFLGYTCSNNVGQLKSDIQLTCAKAYADFVSGKKSDIEISSLDLNIYIRNGLYKRVDHRALWNRLIRITDRLCIFEPAGENKIIDENINNGIYEIIDLRMNELKNKNINEEEIYELLKSDVNDFFSETYERMKISAYSLENLFGEKILSLAVEILNYSQEKLKRKFNDKIHFAVTIHIANLSERLKNNKKIVNKNLNSIKEKNPIEFEIAVECIKIIEQNLDITVPLDEAGFLCIFFLLDEKSLSSKKYLTKVIVLAHGKSTATSMAEAVNELLGINYAVGINANLDESPENVLEKVKEYVYKMEEKIDILLLVDMGSLINFAEELEQLFSIKVKIIPLVSTLHVLESTRKAVMFKSLDEIYKDTLNVNDYTSTVLTNNFKGPNSNKKFQIISVCSSGCGTAKIIKNILKSKLEFPNENFDIVTIDYSDSFVTRLNEVEKKGKILCIVSNFEIQYTVPIFTLEEIVSEQKIPNIQKLIDEEIPFLKLEETLKKFIQKIEIRSAIKDVETFIFDLSRELDINLEKSNQLGIIIHMICLIDRIKLNKFNAEFVNMEKFILENNTLFNTVKKFSDTLNKKYKIIIPDSEICYITKFFDRLN